MLGYHYHDDENGKTYKCEDVDCDVVKKRMEMYSQLAHKEEEMLEKYEKTVELRDSITKRRKSIASTSHRMNGIFHHLYLQHSDGVHTTNYNNGGGVHIDKRLNDIIAFESFSPKLRRYSVPSKLLISRTKHSPVGSNTQRPLSSVEETHTSSTEDLRRLSVMLQRKYETVTRCSSTPNSPDTIKRQSIVTTSKQQNLTTPTTASTPLCSLHPSMATRRRKSSEVTSLTCFHGSPIATRRQFNATQASEITSAQILCSTVKRMRKISVSADHLDEIKSHTAVNSLNEAKRLNVSEDNIHFVTLSSREVAELPNERIRHSMELPNERIRHSMEHLNTFRTPSPKRKQTSEIVAKRRLQAKQKQEERQNLINNLNTDIKKANRYLRNLRTRSMPLLDELNINFEIPFHFIKAVLKSKHDELERASVDLIV